MCSRRHLRLASRRINSAGPGRYETHFFSTRKLSLLCGALGSGVYIPDVPLHVSGVHCNNHGSRRS